jgi:beta-glucosidase
VIRAKGTGITRGSDEDIATAVTAAKASDLAILTLGEFPGETRECHAPSCKAEAMSGEAASRANLGLPGRQEELLEAVIATGKPVVLVLFSGRPLTVPWAVEHVPAILAAWLPGTEGGPALARTLFGDFNPSGKLVVSWPRSVGQEPLYYNALNTGRPPDNIDLTQAPRDVTSKYVSRVQAKKLSNSTFVSKVRALLSPSAH